MKDPQSPQIQVVTIEDHDDREERVNLKDPWRPLILKQAELMKNSWLCKKQGLTMKGTQSPRMTMSEECTHPKDE